jgi:hypothetical protein
MKEDAVLRGQIAAHILASLVTAHPTASDDALAGRAVSLADTLIRRLSETTDDKDIQRI